MPAGAGEEGGAELPDVDATSPFTEGVCSNELIAQTANPATSSTAPAKSPIPRLRWRGELGTDLRCDLAFMEELRMGSDPRFQNFLQTAAIAA